MQVLMLVTVESRIVVVHWEDQLDFIDRFQRCVVSKSNNSIHDLV